MSLVPSLQFRSIELPSMPFDMDFSNDGRLLACATASNDHASPVLRVLQTADGETFRSYMQPSYVTCKGVSFVLEGNGLVFIMQREDGSTELLRASLSGGDPEPIEHYSSLSRNHSIVRDALGKLFAVVGCDIEVRDSASGELLHRWQGAERTRHLHAAFSRDGVHLYAYGTATGEVVRYHTATGEETARWPAPSAFGTQVLVTPDERFLVAVGESYQGFFLYDLVNQLRVMGDREKLLRFDEAFLCMPWVTSFDSSLLACLQLSPWGFRLPDLQIHMETADIVPSGARAFAAAWAWEAPIIAFGTLMDSTVRWFELVESEGDPFGSSSTMSSGV